jgi:hypothetical protein
MGTLWHIYQCMLAEMRSAQRKLEYSHGIVIIKLALPFGMENEIGKEV